MKTTQSCTLYLVRHGQTDWNVKRLTQGHTDIPLNAVGIDQAGTMREQLKDVQFDAVFTSDLLRAQKTAQILNLERNLALTSAQALRERTYGIFDGKTIEETHKALGNLLEEYSNHPFIKESGVETNEKMVARVLTFIREISLGYEGKTVLLVSHGSVMKHLLIHLGFCKAADFAAKDPILNLAYIVLSSNGSEVLVKTTFGVQLTH